MKKKLLWLFPMFVLLLSSPEALRAENATDYILKGNNLANKKQYAEAIEEYQKAGKMDPKNKRVPLLISLCYAQSGDLDKGLSYAKSAAKSNASYISFYNLGLIYAARQDSDKALEAFNQALTLNPNSLNAQYQKGLVYAALKDYDQAISHYESVLKLNPSLDKVRLSLFGAFLEVGNRKAAETQIEEFRKMKKSSIALALEARMKRPVTNV